MLLPQHSGLKPRNKSILAILEFDISLMIYQIQTLQKDKCDFQNFHKGPSINYVAKRDRQTICQNTTFTTQTDRPFDKIRHSQKSSKNGNFTERLQDFKKHFQSPFADVNTDFPVVMEEFFVSQKKIQKISLFSILLVFIDSRF